MSISVLSAVILRSDSWCNVGFLCWHFIH